MQKAKKSTKKRIAICAQSFGFGPVSKACAIAKALLNGSEHLELVFIADSVSKEFMMREGLWDEDRDLTISDHMVKNLTPDDFGNLEAAVVVLDPNFASFFHPWVPTYFVDSLGFMWDDSFFQQFECLQIIHTYFVQDVFGASDKLSAKGVSNICQVGAIIDTSVSLPGYTPDITFHLGGLINIFDRAPIQNYVEGIMPILKNLSTGLDSAILTSQFALDEFEVLRESKIPVYNLPHDKSLGVFVKSASVLSSPGLTTLLELTCLQIPLIPLPPQNLSQAMIINNIAELWDNAPDIWRFLAEHYKTPEDIDEEEGVSLVQNLNRQLLNKSEFGGDYIAHAIKAKDQCSPIPSNLVANFDGAKDISVKINADISY